ncbi:MAG: UshA-like (seleno)protein [Deltaproteobacteria bacterium]
MRWVICTVLTALAGIACKNGKQAPSAAQASRGFEPARKAEIYFSTEVAGYVEPCGCTTKPLGGVQRLATVVRRGHEHRAVVDAGNLLFPPDGVNDVTREQHILKAKILGRVYRQLGAVALNVGPSDLADGADFLQSLQQEGATPFVSANVRPAEETGPTIARSFVRKIGSIKVGFTGVAPPEKIASAKTAVTVIEYAPGVASEVKVLRDEGAEVVVVLAHLSLVDAKALAKAVPNIDVILRAPGTPIERDPAGPVREGKVIIAEAGSQGQHIGRLTLAFGADAPERPLVLDDAGAAELKRRQLAERKIRAYQMEVDAWSVDPKKAEAVKAKKAQIAQIQADLDRPLPPSPPPSGPHVRVDIVRLTEDIPADPAMTKLLEVYYRELHAMNLTKGDTEKCAPKEGAATFVGTAKCVECHEEAYAFWKKTKHAKAWATLEDDGKHFDLTCIGCHTVGYEQAGGFCRLADVKGYEDVGCENCHGPGSIHIEDQDPSSIVLESPESTCADGCHVPEHSDAFVYEKYLREITGPGHELDES